MSSSGANKLTTVLFNKSLSTMVKGIRNHKDKGESDYIAKCMQEIKDELKSSYPDVKATAIQKLIYLQMVGYDMQWASFHVIEVMSQPWFGHKRIGYLAAALAFTPTTDVILLTTHLFRKGFTQTMSSNTGVTEGLQYETGAAISCLANICTPDLANDLLSDLYGMMNSARPYIRKKATLVLLKIFHQWPKALRLSFDRLKEKLEDENQGVVSAAVYVICELAAKNPQNYLSLAPQFFKILTTSSNNWVLIKVVKLLGSLVPLEPRLAKKLVEPLTDIITTTPAKSLLYECVNTLLSGKITSKAVIRLCLEKLRTFIENPDQNLKYLGLLGLHKLMRAHPRVVAEHKDLILDCLKDDDVTIRQRALDLITSMVSKRNLTGIVRRLIDHLETSDGAYREHVLERIIFICSQKGFAFVSDFEWYINTLVDLTHLQGVSRDNTDRIRSQLMDVAIRVPAVRKFAVSTMVTLLLSGRLLVDSHVQNTMCDVLGAAAFIVGEFAEYLDEHLEVITAMLKPQVAALSFGVQNMFVHNVLKVYSSGLSQPFDLDEKALRSQELERQREVEREAKEKARIALLAADNDALEKKAIAAAYDEIDMSGGAGAATPTAVEPERNDAVINDEKDTNDGGVRRAAGIASRRRTFAEWSRFAEQMSEIMIAQLPLFTHSNFVEVQERGVAYLEFVRWFARSFGFPCGGTSSPAPATATATATTTANATSPSSPSTAAAAASTPVVETPQVLNVLSLPGFVDPLSTPSTNPSVTVTPVAPVPSISTVSPVTNGNGILSQFGSTEEAKRFVASAVNQFAAFFADALNPVNPRAQKLVQLPAGLDLDRWINPEPKEKDDIDDDDGYSLDGSRSSRRSRNDRDRDGDDNGSGRSRRRSRGGDDDDYVKKPLSAEEIEEAKKRRAAIKARQALDPFYIPSSSDAPKSSAADVPPLDKLEDGSLGPLKVGSGVTSPTTPAGGRVGTSARSGRSDRRRRDSFDEPETKSGKDYAVVTAEEMPEGHVEEAPKKGHADELDMDLDTPLGADEVMPKVQTYADKARTAASSSSSKKDDKSSSSSSSRSSKDKHSSSSSRSSRSHRSDKDKDGSKRSDKDKSKSSSSRSSSHRSSDKDKDNKEKKDATTTAAAAPASTPVIANIIDYDPLDPLSTKPPAAAVSASPAPASSTSSSSETKSSSSSSSSSTPRERSLFKDSTVKISYQSKAAPVAPGGSSRGASASALVMLRIEYNPSSSRSHRPSTLKSLQLDINNHRKARVSAVSGAESKGRSTDAGVLISLAELPKRVVLTDMVKIDWSSALDGSIKLTTSLTYWDDKGKGKSKQICDLVLPWSTFVVAKRIAAPELATILGGAAAMSLGATGLGEVARSGTGNCVASASRSITLARHSVPDALKLVSSILNVQLIEAVAFTAMYYGQLATDNSHICALVKAKKGDNTGLGLEIKTPSQSLSDALLDELVAHLT